MAPEPIKVSLLTVNSHWALLVAVGVHEPVAPDKASKTKDVEAVGQTSQAVESYAVSHEWQVEWQNSVTTQSSPSSVNPLGQSSTHY